MPLGLQTPLRVPKELNVRFSSDLFLQSFVSSLPIGGLQLILQHRLFNQQLIAGPDCVDKASAVQVNRVITGKAQANQNARLVRVTNRVVMAHSVVGQSDWLVRVQTGPVKDVDGLNLIAVDLYSAVVHLAQRLDL